MHHLVNFPLSHHPLKKVVLMGSILKHYFCRSRLFMPYSQNWAQFVTFMKLTPSRQTEKLNYYKPYWHLQCTACSKLLREICECNSSYVYSSTILRAKAKEVIYYSGIIIKKFQSKLLKLELFSNVKTVCYIPKRYILFFKCHQIKR